LKFYKEQTFKHDLEKRIMLFLDHMRAYCQS